MPSDYQARYRKLNSRQQQAVDTVDGPLVVVAGPGTGKTQLLSMRVAAILQQPHITPDQILCLTFTDNAARNMQDRLVSIIGRPAYHVAVHTFHSFADRIINNYPDAFTKRLLLRPLDELGIYQLLRNIFDKLPHADPLSTRLGDDYIYLKDTYRTIGWLKQAALSPAEFQEILARNQEFFEATSAEVSETFQKTPSAKQLEQYAEIAAALSQAPSSSLPGSMMSYAELSARELVAAIELTDTTGRYAPHITTWRRRWLEKNAEGNYVFKDALQLPKLTTVAQIYADLLDAMQQAGSYDFDDMLLEVVHALESHPELALNLSERYQYILVDEFQDTNQAQLRLLWALGDVPPNENRPNIMVVGDPNQAIYAFQGAFNSSFQQFINRYEDVRLINLTDNYRSTKHILEASYEVIRQQPAEQHVLTTDQLALVAHASHEQSLIEHDVLASELAHYQWVADTVQAYLDQGIQPQEIAIIAPRHRYLERIVPYLATNNIPIAYERREDILDAPLVQELLRMAELVVAIADNRQDDIDYLIGEVLGYDFWEIDPGLLLSVSVDCYEERCHWLPSLLASEQPQLKRIAEWFYSLGHKARTEPLEYMLDELGGGRPTRIITPDDGAFVSPFNSYYFGQQELKEHTERYLNHLGQLTALRQRLRSWQPDKTLYLHDLLTFVTLHQQAGVNILNTNPHTEAAHAVQLMTAYKAKGLEFAVVFVINAQEEVWGSRAREYVDRIRLPRNLPVKPAGDTEADKLRLFYVALTRAKHTLHVVSYQQNLDDKLSLGLGFVGGNTADSQPAHPAFAPTFIDRQAGSEAVRLLATAWAYKYRQLIADKPTLFGPILEHYRLSATHLNNFLNVIDAGPEYFLRHNLLRFPEAMSPAAAYGDAIHQTLKMISTEYQAHGKLPAVRQYAQFFEDVLAGKHLRNSDHDRYRERGTTALKVYCASRREFLATDMITERNFSNEGVVIGDARLSGKIDVLLRTSDSSFTVIDYKTGKPAKSWQSTDEFEKIKLHRYRQQLYFYKLLVDNSATYGRKYLVQQGGLEFVETTSKHTALVDTLWLSYDDEELARIAMLIQAVWFHIMNLQLPDTTQYPQNLSGIIQFETDVIEAYRAATLEPKQKSLL